MQRQAGSSAGVRCASTSIPSFSELQQWDKLQRMRRRVSIPGLVFDGVVGVDVGASAVICPVMVQLVLIAPYSSHWHASSTEKGFGQPIFTTSCVTCAIEIS